MRAIVAPKELEQPVAMDRGSGELIVDLLLESSDERSSIRSRLSLPHFIEALGEPAIDLGEHCARLVAAAVGVAQ